MLRRSCKCSKCLVYLEKFINEIDPNQDTTRAGKFNRAIVSAKNISNDEWKRMSFDLKKFKNNLSSCPELSVPTAMQVKVDENLEDALLSVENNIREALELRTLQTRYEFEILFFTYLDSLKQDIMNVGEVNTKEEDLTGPDMVKILVQILLLNRESDKAVIKKIKQALLEWEE